MPASHVQCGVTNHRINREPLDNETVLSTYSDLEERMSPIGLADTKEGSFYAGLITSVVNDENESYNGPYYISYETAITDKGETAISYTADRVPLQAEVTKQMKQMDKDLRHDIYESAFSWGHLA